MMLLCRFNIAAHPDVQRSIKSELSAAGLLHQGQVSKLLTVSSWCCAYVITHQLVAAI